MSVRLEPVGCLPERCVNSPSHHEVLSRSICLNRAGSVEAVLYFLRGIRSKSTLARQGRG